ncbi:putative chemoreceptor glutamine deamidase CheD 2 [Desulfosarcina alkanivorans]|jgi:chemotaxis protein CheD|uniref:Probable chemoreceptor glutamine deamidase CheD n=1 Tax=Desulfosarcina alkanivorans TaxID=571177 RepID=A0A5K7YPV5_9BACT|nr:putative chemoreceptor glutamine deamidase CheD 2 [Desulfosarcina alkanivorans]
MSAPEGGLPVVYLNSAELCFAQRPARVTTVLGSCITVTLFHPTTRTAAICHALLPRGKQKSGCGEESGKPFKYVDEVIPIMVARMRRYGIQPRQLEAKLFGGADMFPAGQKHQFQIPVGRQNIEAAMQAIASEGLHLKVAEVGGKYGRKLFFYTHTGVVMVKPILNRNGSGELGRITSARHR